MRGKEGTSKADRCYCCNRPLTFVSKKAEENGETPIGKSGIIESWECMNQDCITYRMRNLKPPTPPLSK